MGFSNLTHSLPLSGFAIFNLKCSSLSSSQSSSLSLSLRFPFFFFFLSFLLIGHLLVNLGGEVARVNQLSNVIDHLDTDFEFLPQFVVHGFVFPGTLLLVVSQRFSSNKRLHSIHIE